MADNETYEVFALRYAQFERRTHQNFIRTVLPDGAMPMDFFVWVIRNEARTVIVDTGFSRRVAARLGIVLDIDPVDALEKIGIPAGSVQHIILTHLHSDHSGNLDRFPNAIVHVQESEVSYATGPRMLYNSIRTTFEVEDVLTFVRRLYASQVRFYDGDAVVFPGISVHLLPGHTNGLQGVLVNTKRGPILLTSDASHYYANYRRSEPYPLTLDFAATLDTYRRLIDLAGDHDHIIPGHDPLVRELYPTSRKNGVELTSLHSQPKPHATAS